MTSVGQCPCCRYTYPADLADVAVPRHAPTHSAGEWAEIVSAAHRAIGDEDNRHAERLTGLRSQLDAAMTWVAAAQTGTAS